MFPSRLEELRDEQTNIEFSKRDLKAKLVGIPLHVMGDLGKNLLVYSLGFQWLLDLSYKLQIPNIYTELTQISYVFRPLRSFLDTHQHFNIIVYNSDKILNQYISSFSSSKIGYRINAVNFLLVPLNYIFRNLGKIIGYAIVAPFTIPAYLGITAFFGIKKFFNQRQITKEEAKQKAAEVALYNIVLSSEKKDQAELSVSFKESSPATILEAVATKKNFDHDVVPKSVPPSQEAGSLSTNDTVPLYENESSQRL